MKKLILIFTLASLAAACEGQDTQVQRTQSAPLSISGAPDKSATLSRSLAAFPDSILLPWGAGEGQVGLIPAAPERAAFGPLSAAIGNDGTVFILDQVNGRLVELAPNGTWRGTRPAPLAPTDLSVDSAGRPAVLSLVNHRLSIVEEQGVVEEIETPMVLQVGALSSTRQGDFLLLGAHQETFRLGRPGAWIGWPDLLKTKVEGHAQECGGEPLQTLLQDGRAWLLHRVPLQQESERVELQGTEGVASAVVLASLSSNEALVVLERWQGAGVVRSLARYGPSGELHAETPLVGQPVSFPFKDLVPADDSAVLRLLPHEDGLRLEVIRVGGAS
ncbi:MAG: hypothetical protein CO108_27875 [Deltaproteobacteria bacterium CG_4_9_14_3_um_filter_63_12]|nr:MAG: hypothetical protein CO108_27875 [Deltaproteobacteria bacterium CG_4_9_14_3_um_filter_63_12]